MYLLKPSRLSVFFVNLSLHIEAIIYNNVRNRTKVRPFVHMTLQKHHITVTNDQTSTRQELCRKELLQLQASAATSQMFQKELVKHPFPTPDWSQGSLTLMIPRT